jgi:hypothetical protein
MGTSRFRRAKVVITCQAVFPLNRITAHKFRFCDIGLVTGMAVNRVGGMGVEVARHGNSTARAGKVSKVSAGWF